MFDFINCYSLQNKTMPCKRGKLIAQCFVFPVLFNSALAITQGLALGNSALFLISYSLSNTMFHVFQHTQIILLIAMSPKIRQDFIKFYDF